MKDLLKIQAALLLIGLLTALVPNARQCALSFSLGAGLMTLNIGFLAWAWSNILQKKLIALSVSLIVLKYALLGIVIYQILLDGNTQPGWFSVGLGSLLVSISLYTVREKCRST